MFQFEVQKSPNFLSKKRSPNSRNAYLQKTIYTYRVERN